MIHNTQNNAHIQAVTSTTNETNSNVDNRQLLTGAQAVVAVLRAHQIDTIFGIPGVHTLSLYDAIQQENGLRHILARHEQGAGFMAEGYARATGRVGVVCTITGPGATNVATPAASAYADSVPLLVISSTLGTNSPPDRRGELHEIKDQLTMFGSLLGWTGAATRIEEVPTVLHEALEYLRNGRPRAAYVQLPYNLFEESALFEIPQPGPIVTLAPQSEPIQQAANLLRAAQRPLIIAGNGVTASGANEQLAQLATLLQAPIILGPKSHDVLPTNHPLLLTTNDSIPEELYEFTSSSDLTLVIGSKLGAERTAHGQLPLPQPLIHIDIDPSEFGRNYPLALGITSDARLALSALIEDLADLARPTCTRQDEIAAMRATLLARNKQAHPKSFAYLEAVQAALPANAIVATDMTLLAYAAAQYLPVQEPRTFIHPAEFCSIGCGFPLALGAKIARPDRPVVALCGDGGFLLNVSELGTAAQENIPLVTVIFNDGTFATVKQEQRRRFNGRYIATDLLAPDYLTLARAFHVNAIQAKSPAELTSLLSEALHNNDGPVVIDVPLPPKEW